MATDSVNCFGGSDGSAITSTSGGTGSYSYLWSNGQSDSTATGLTVGAYKIIVKDIYGCKDSITASIFQPTVLKMDITITNPSCYGYNDGVLKASLSGGTPSYSLEWNENPNLFDETLSNLYSGNYKIEVVDKNGCRISDQFDLVDPQEIIVNIPDTSYGLNNISSKMVTSITPSNDYMIEWDPANLFEDPKSSTSSYQLSLGKYAIRMKATDNNGCFGEDNGIILVLGQFIPNVFSPNNDGINDIFGQIKNFKVKELNIFNRWGEKVYYSSKGIPWDGKLKGNRCPLGAYRYQMELEFIHNGMRFFHSGTIMLIE